MEKSTSSLKFEVDSHLFPEAHATSKCSTCNEEFEAPLFAVISSGYLLEEYYACPRCLSRVGSAEHNKAVETDEAEEKEEKVEKIQELKIEDKREDTVACAHHLGYLKRRPKSTPIPEECLTCTKMIECMTY